MVLLTWLVRYELRIEAPMIDLRLIGNRLFRATKLLEIGAGTTEVRKLIISGELLK